MTPIYLDNAASTRVSDEVLALMTKVMRTAWGNPQAEVLRLGLQEQADNLSGVEHENPQDASGGDDQPRARRTSQTVGRLGQKLGFAGVRNEMRLESVREGLCRSGNRDGATQRNNSALPTPYRRDPFGKRADADSDGRQNPFAPEPANDL